MYVIFEAGKYNVVCEAIGVKTSHKKSKLFFNRLIILYYILSYNRKSD